LLNGESANVSSLSTPFNNMSLQVNKSMIQPLIPTLPNINNNTTNQTFNISLVIERLEGSEAPDEIMKTIVMGLKEKGLKVSIDD